MILAVLQQHCGIALHAQRRLRLHRRRRPADRAGQRPRRRDRAGLGRHRVPHRRRAWSRSARSAWPARCARCATCRSGSPRPRGSGFRVAVVPVGDRSATPRQRTVDGMTVLEVGDLRGALSALGVAGHGCAGPPRRRLTRPLARPARGAIDPAVMAQHDREALTDAIGRAARCRSATTASSATVRSRHCSPRRLGGVDVRAAVRRAQRLRLDPRAPAPARSGSRRSTSTSRRAGATCPAR